MLFEKRIMNALRIRSRCFNRSLAASCWRAVMSCCSWTFSATRRKSSLRGTKNHKHTNTKIVRVQAGGTRSRALASEKEPQLYFPTEQAGGHTSLSNPCAWQSPGTAESLPASVETLPAFPLQPAEPCPVVEGSSTPPSAFAFPQIDEESHQTCPRQERDPAAWCSSRFAPCARTPAHAPEFVVVAPRKGTVQSWKKKVSKRKNPILLVVVQ